MQMIEIWYLWQCKKNKSYFIFSIQINLIQLYLECFFTGNSFINWELWKLGAFKYCSSINTFYYEFDQRLKIQKINLIQADKSYFESSTW